MTGLPTTYTTRELAESLKCSVETVRDLVKQGYVRPLRLSSSKFAEMRFTEADVEALQRAMRPPKPPPKRRRKRAP